MSNFGAFRIHKQSPSPPSEGGAGDYHLGALFHVGSPLCIARFPRWATTFLFLLLALASSVAQETPESRAFRAAVDSFQLKLYERSEREFRQFVETFPQSTLLPEAILFQARSALNQTNLSKAISLLTTHADKAGPLADQYQYRLANAYLQNSNYLAAANSFLFITRQLTNSLLLLEASHGEALAHARLRDYPKVISLLRDPAGTFQQASRARPSDVFALRGHLLLAEALFGAKEYRAAEDAARRLPEEILTPEFRWDRQYLICQIQVADRRLTEALSQTTNLIALAAPTASRNLLADSLATQAGILEQLNRLDEAIQVYNNNLSASVPPDRRRLALLNIIEIKLTQDAVGEADEMLQTFLARQPEDAASDVVLLTSGEMQLKMHLRQARTNLVATPDSPTTATNHLQAAMAQFDRLLTVFTNSPVRGKALLNKGWCLWLDNKSAESALAFRAATELLPFSEDLAVARFKLADCLFDRGDYTNALQLYRSVTNDFVSLPLARHWLLDQALFQMVRASVRAGDTAAAAATIRQMLEWTPESELTQRAIWLAGQDRLRVREPQQARAIFTDFLNRFPGPPLTALVELAVARTYQLEGDWKAALRRYEEWLSTHAGDAEELHPRAEFARALAAHQALGSTHAFPLFTNFVARFPTNELARTAQFWVAQEFFRQGNYPEALRQFQIIPENTNWAITNLTFQARFMAGRSAYAAQLWKDAAGSNGHFTVLLNDRSCPDDIVAEALFAHGDTTTQQDADPADPLQRYVVARTTFAKIPQLYPTNRLVPLAWGRIGDCSLQLASQDPKQYETATNAYQQAMLPPADIATRSLAEFGIGRALQAQAVSRPPAESVALLKIALDHYLNIFLANNVNTTEGEQPDPNWIEHSGLAAGRLAEELKQWAVAVPIYERLQKLFPPLRQRLQDKIERLQDQLVPETERRNE